MDSPFRDAGAVPFCCWCCRSVCVWLGMIAGLALLASPAVLMSQAAEEPPPDTLREGLGYVLHEGATKAEGFYQMQKPVYYLLDPGLGEKESFGILPDDDKATSRPAASRASDPRKEIPTSWSLILEQDKARQGLIIENQVRDVFDDFFKYACQRPQRMPSLKEFLETTVAKEGEVRPLFAVGVDFEAHGPSREVLHCEVELRLFRVELKPSDFHARADLTRCELIYRDRASGQVSLASFRGRQGEAGGAEGNNEEAEREAAKRAVRAAVIQALRNGLAVNFCLNPRIDHKSPVDNLYENVCGRYSVSQYSERGR